MILAVEIHEDGVPLFHPGTKNHLGHLVLHVFLERALQRASTKLHVVALVGNELFGRFGKCYLVTQVANTLVEAHQLQVDDLVDRLPAQLVEHHQVVYPVQELGSERPVQRFLDDAAGILHVAHIAVGVEPDAATKVLQLARTDVGSHDQDGVLEIDLPSQAVRHVPLVQYLEEDIEDVGVCFLDLV